jgi:antitoxin PrlF
MTITVSSKGQITLPAEARRKLGIRTGSKLECFVRGDDRLEIIRIGGSIRDLKGVLPKPRRALSLADMQKAIVRGATRKAK